MPPERPGPSRFYDDLAEWYDLIFPDWEESMARQAEAIARMLRGLGSEKPLERFRILDVTAGIGTQALPLASLGYDVTARDLSGAAIDRLGREAAARGLAIDAAQADMRTVSESVDGRFDAIIAFDNSIPHLLTDAEIAAALEGFRRLLAPGGALLLSVRDYEAVERGSTSRYPHGERTRGGRTYRLFQDWTWVDRSRYRTAFVIAERRARGWVERVRTEAIYYAVPLARLLELLEEAGFVSCRESEVPFYQPVLVGLEPVPAVGNSASRGRSA